MFEKEAEEYAIDNYETCLYDDLPYANDSKAREQAFKDGAKYGYEKGIEFGIKSAEQVNNIINNNAKEWLYEENEKLKDIIRQLIANAPNTYSGTNIELQQKKMFSFQNAVNKAKQFLKEIKEND